MSEEVIIVSWQKDGSFALLLARCVCVCKHLLRDRLVTFYINNKPTRLAVIRGKVVVLVAHSCAQSLRNANLRMEPSRG